MILTTLCFWLLLSKASAIIAWHNINDTQLNDVESAPQTCANVPSPGVHRIQPEFGFNDEFLVLCDQDYSGGGWTVIQNRFDGSVDFYRGWKEYENGFGDLRGEFWLGLKRIYQLVAARQHELHILMQDVDGKTAVAKYSSFSMTGPMLNYMVDSLGTYSGDAGDSFKIAEHLSFSTMDADHDGHATTNCGSLYKSGWWFKACHDGNLNGLYKPGPSEESGMMMSWSAFRGFKYGLKRSRMMIRPVYK
ncbi:fibrinogen C domain-containing protein 1-like [Ochlerotatus camptorhynchus]|uniref:fibrinogen C domain-containing protein 1-like n=1 Tax=Ochlerotatus camptorhynchus TaxID=644619 RepID=UPI0031DDCC69